MRRTGWVAEGWGADWWSGRLAITHPHGDCGVVAIRDVATGRDVTLQQWRAAVKSHGVARAAKTFWELRAGGGKLN